MAGGAAPVGAYTTTSNLTRKQFLFAFSLVTSLFFLWGFSYGLVDVLNKKVQTTFTISHLQSTMIQVAYFGAYIVFSPVAAMFASRFGYKAGIFLGLTLYCCGALAFWPTAHYEKYFGFPLSAFIIACGLATLETMANSYITVLGDAKHAAFRLNIAQSANGLAAFIGPLIASKAFYGHDQANSLGGLQYTYLAVACLGAAIIVLFAFAKLPEISEQMVAESQESFGIVDERPLWKRKHTIFGFLAQFFYVGAQVTCATFIVNYLADNAGHTNASASQMLSYMQITFMVARFASIPFVRFLSPATVVSIWATMCAVFALVAGFTNPKTVGTGALFVVFFFESAIYPTVFSLATGNLGKHSKRGAGLLCMGVGGGAVLPPAQGAVSDRLGAPHSYFIPAIGFFCTALYGYGMIFYERRMAKTIADQAMATPNAQGTLDRADSSDEKYVEEEKLETTHIA
ncbi:uncharacterized protein JCM15063_005121 [Sporobolomyces koalae]|uniref:uncharacterized protein n=1 Tax=Sporobolomyces koalae TaxID=500713 RepID=UPI00316BAF04